MKRNIRDDVAEELTESHGWRESAEGDGALFRRGVKWGVVAADGTSVLTVTGTPEAPGYAIPFSPHVPHYLIVRACEEATADCWRCGTACEGDCREPDGILPGLDGDGRLMGHHGY